MARAISPVVATALLVLIAIATAALLYLWVSGTVYQPTEAPALKKRLKIEAVEYYNGTGWTVVNVSVRNVGEVPVNVTTLYVIDDINGSIVGVNDTLKTIILPNQVKFVYVNITGLLVKGRPYVAKVVTADGVEATYVFVVRSG